MNIFKEIIMKKLTAIVLALTLLLAFSACTQKPLGEVNTSPAEIEKAIADALGDNYLCDMDYDEEMFFSNFGFDKNKIESYVAKASMMSTHPDTVVILKTKDGYADEAVDILNEIYGNRIRYGRDYPMNLPKILAARIIKCGDYVMYIIAGGYYDGTDEEESAKFTADEYKKIDDAIAGIFGEAPENLAVVPDGGYGGGGMVVG